MVVVVPKDGGDSQLIDHEEGIRPATVEENKGMHVLLVEGCRGGMR